MKKDLVPDWASLFHDPSPSLDFFAASTNALKIARDGSSSSTVLIALSRKGPLCRVLRNRALRYIGTISYSMYLIHMTAILWTQARIENRYLSAAVALGITVLYATISWFGLERNLLGIKRAS